MNLPILAPPMSRIIQCLPSVSGILFSRFTCVVACMYENSIPFGGWILFHCKSIPHAVHPFLIDGTQVVPTLWLWGITLQWPLAHKDLFDSLFSSPLGICKTAQLPDPMVVLCLPFWGTAKLFSTAARPFYIPASNEQGFQVLYILTNTCYFLFFPNSLLMGVKQLPHGVHCFSLLSVNRSSPCVDFYSYTQYSHLRDINKKHWNASKIKHRVTKIQVNSTWKRCQK